LALTGPTRFVVAAATVVIGLFTAAILVGRLETEPEVTNAVKAGSTATVSAIYAASFPDTDGVPRPLAQWSQKLLVINFWATWCAPCLEEIPLLVKAQQNHGSKGLQIVGIAADSRANVVKFVEKLAINYPSLVDEAGAIAFSQRLGNRFGLLPFTVVISPAGQIVLVKLGVISAEEIEGLVSKHLQ
jgi:thiol-disulfide isomerase/thioredoxin